MRKPTNCSESINTIKLAELDKRFELHVQYQKEAVDRAAIELRERLAAMNEFREQLKDQAARFITREEMVIQIDSLANRLTWAVGVIATLAGGSLGSLVAYLLR